MDGKHYLIRFSVNHNEYMLSVSGRGEDNIPIFQHFTIKITQRYDQSEYEINGAGKKFDDFSEMLQYYEENPISFMLHSIGKPYISTLNEEPELPRYLPKIHLKQ